MKSVWTLLCNQEIDGELKIVVSLLYREHDHWQIIMLVLPLSFISPVLISIKDELICILDHNDPLLVTQKLYRRVDNSI